MRLAPFLGAAAAAWSLSPSFAPADDAALTAQAIQMCKQAVNLKEEAGSMLEGPALVLKSTGKLDDWRFESLLPENAGPAQPKTVFCVHQSFNKVGTYTDGSEANETVWTVTALSWPDGRVRRKGTLTGSPPQTKKTRFGDYRQNEYGSVSASQLESWLRGPVSDLMLATFAGLAFLSPDRRTVAVAVGDQEAAAQLFDWPSQAPRQRVGKSWPTGFLADGRLALPYKNETILWDVTTARESGKLPFSVRVLSRDGTLALSEYKTQGFWDVASRRRLSDSDRLNLWHTASAMSTDGRYACALVSDKVTLWDTTNGRAAATFEVKDVSASHMSTSSSRCAVSGDGKLVVYDVREGLYKLTVADLSVQRLGDTLHSSCLGLSSDGRWLAAGGYDGAMHLWDLTVGHEVMHTPAKSGLLCDLVFSPDDALLRFREGVLAADGHTHVWDTQRLIAQAAGPRH